MVDYYLNKHSLRVFKFDPFAVDVQITIAVFNLQKIKWKSSFWKTQFDKFAD